MGDIYDVFDDRPSTEDKLTAKVQQLETENIYLRRALTEAHAEHAGAQEKLHVELYAVNAENHALKAQLLTNAVDQMPADSTLIKTAFLDTLRQQMDELKIELRKLETENTALRDGLSIWQRLARQYEGQAKQQDGAHEAVFATSSVLDAFDPSICGTLAERVKQVCDRAQVLPTNRFDCPHCGPAAIVDEDGCCVTCGKDATAVVMTTEAELEELRHQHDGLPMHAGMGKEHQEVYPSTTEEQSNRIEYLERVVQELEIERDRDRRFARAWKALAKKTRKERKTFKAMWNGLREELPRQRDRAINCGEGNVCGTVGQQCQKCLRAMYHREVARREYAERRREDYRIALDGIRSQTVHVLSVKGKDDE